jgi:hypothetical protein
MEDRATSRNSMVKGLHVTVRSRIVLGRQAPECVLKSVYCMDLHVKGEEMNRLVLVLTILVNIAVIAFVLVLGNEVSRTRMAVADLNQRIGHMGQEIRHAASRIDALNEKTFAMEKDLAEIATKPDDPLYTAYQNDIRTRIAEQINTIVKTRPSGGGKWFVTQVRFEAPDIVVVNYEDGHFSGQMKLRILRPAIPLKFRRIP